MARVLDSVTLPIKKNGTKTNQNYVNNPKSTAGQFSASTAYAVGQYVYYNKKLYRFTSAHAAGAWNASHVTEVTVTSELTSLKAETNELKQDFNEYHPDLGSGYSAQLLSTVFIEDETPYNFRTSGGSADIGDREYDEIVGVSMPINQQAGSQDRTASDNGITISFDHNTGKTTVTVPDSPTGFAQLVYYGTHAIEGHKYLICTDKPLVNGMEVYIGGTTGIRGAFSAPKNQTAIEVGKASSTTLQFYVGQSTEAGTYEYYAQIFDLTLMLGTTIADYVYGLEQSTAGSGVTWLKHHFPKIFDSGYIPYTAGEMQSVSGLSVHRMTGFNQWDEEWELGYYSSSTGGYASRDNGICSKRDKPIPILPNTVYCLTVNYGSVLTTGVCFYDANDNFISFEAVYSNDPTFTTPNGAQYMRFYLNNAYGTVYNHDICINLHWDGERDGQYEEYKEYEYALDDSVVLRGKLELDSNNNLRANGDRYLPDGTIDRTWNEADLGSLTWTRQTESSTSVSYFATTISDMVTDYAWSTQETDINIVGIPYKYKGASSGWSTMPDDSFGVAGTSLRIRDDSYSDAASFKAAMSGVKLVYPLATLTTETAEPYQTPQIVDDWGTEEYVSTSLVPVGHDTKYANNLRAKLEISPDSPEEDGDYIVRHSNGENQYVALGSTTTIQGILDRLTALENA